MILRKKVISIVMSVAMVFSMTAVGAFADETNAQVLSNVTLIGAAPFANATNVAPGSNAAKQPIRIALSSGASTVAADIDSYIQIKNGTTAISVSASTDGKIVVITPDTVLSSSTVYTVDFNDTNLPRLTDYTFTTSSGGTGTGGGSGTGGGGRQQSLTMTGQIPVSGAIVSAGQSLYVVFSNSLLPGSNNQTSYADLKAHNEGQIKVKTASGTVVTTGCSIEIIDNWTVKVSTSDNETMLPSGSYVLDIDPLTANNNKVYSGTEILFTIAS